METCICKQDDDIKIGNLFFITSKISNLAFCKHCDQLFTGVARNSSVGTFYLFKNGLLHNETGPAIFGHQDRSRFFLKGVEYEREHNPAWGDGLEGLRELIEFLKERLSDRFSIRLENKAVLVTDGYYQVSIELDEYINYGLGYVVHGLSNEFMTEEEIVKELSA